MARDSSPSGEITAGTMMRNARETAGLHVAALAVSMKIPVKKLEALEADRLDLLHDAVFVRALAASVCRALKIDSAPVLRKLPLNTAPKLNSDERGINAPFHSPSDAGGMTVPELLRKPTTLIVMVLVVAAIAVFFLPEIKVPDWSVEVTNQTNTSTAFGGQSEVIPPAVESPEPVQTATEHVAVPMVGVQGAPSSVVDASAQFPAAVASSVEMPLAMASAPVLPVAVASQAQVVARRPTEIASRPAPITSPPILAASRPASSPVFPSTGTVVFKAKGSTWVKVVDAKGIVQLSKTIGNGEVVGASGTAPLSVVVGRVDVTDVEVRGASFPLAGFSKDNVARFEVK
jgi:cytoskeleton protein RodZ